MADRSESDNVSRLASQWAVRASEGNMPAVLQAELEAWLAQDPRHLGAFVRAQAMWADLDRMAALSQGAERPVRSQWLRFPALAAGLLMTVAASYFLASEFWIGMERSARGEIRHIAMSDGSLTTLNTSTVIQKDYDANDRRIELREGEAAFEVAHSDSRPFTVEARGVRAVAVGTRFTMRINGDSVEVTVAEGTVRIEPYGQEARPLVEKGQVVEVRPQAQPRLTKLSEPELERRMSWQTGRLMFDGETLATAVREMNRYSEVQIEIGDSGLASENIVGVFTAGDSRTFAFAAAMAVDGRVVEGPGKLRITRK